MGLHCVVHCDDLLKAVSAQQNITNKKGNMAILSHILVEAKDNQLVCTGTDLEIGLRQTIPAEVVEPGAVALPAKKLFELARESGGADIALKEDDKAWVEIEAGPGRYRLAGMDAAEFPQFPGYKEEALAPVEAAALIELIDKTAFAIATDKETVLALTAALLQKHEENGEPRLKMVTSDGHRLCIMSRKAGDIGGLNIGPNVLIPRRGVQEIRKFGENQDSVLLGVEDNQIVLKEKDNLLIIRLMKGEFPDFAALLSNITPDKTVGMERMRLLEALKRMNLFTEDISHAIKISLSRDSITLNSQHTEYGSATDSFAVQYDGEDIELAFNCRYFIDTMQVMEGEMVQAAIKDEKSPCLISSLQDEGFLSVIMPMKL